MTDEVPDFAALFPQLPPELQGLAEDLRQLIKREQEELYMAGFKASLEAIGKVLCDQGAHDLERLVIDQIGVPILHHLHTSIEERRQRG